MRPEKLDNTSGETCSISIMRDYMASLLPQQSPQFWVWSLAVATIHIDPHTQVCYDGAEWHTRKVQS